MTWKRDLKKRVRERQAQTGESYTTALRHVLAQRSQQPPAAVSVVEMVDLTAEAARLGLTCRAAMTPPRAALVDGTHALERVRGALLTTAADPATRLMRGAVLLGERHDLLSGWMQHVDEARRFLARARAGLAGPGAGGHMLALHVDGRGGTSHLVVCLLWPTPPIALADRPHSLVLCGDAGLYADLGLPLV